MALKNKERLKCLESLGLEEDATEDEIKRAYKNLALKHHPDKNPDDTNATKVFQEISESYYLLTTKYAKDRRKKIYMCSNCGDIHYMDSDDEDFYDDLDDQYFEDDDDDDYDLPCDDDEESILWFFGRLFYDVFADFVFERRFQSRNKKSTKWTADEEEEDSFFDSIFKKYRPPQDVELTEEDLKKFHSYDEWLKARHPSKRHNHRVRKGKKKAKHTILQKPKPKSKKQLLAEQRKREQEMREIGQTLLPKMEEKLVKKPAENITSSVKLMTDDHSEEVENQHRTNLQRKLQEEEKLQLLEAQERQKNKRQQRKDMKEKKKQLRQEAEKVLQEKKFSNPAPKRKKTELELHEENQIRLFGNEDINKENVLVDSRRAEEHDTKSTLLGKHFNEIGNLSGHSNKEEQSIISTSQNSNSNSSKTSDPLPKPENRTEKIVPESSSAKLPTSNKERLGTNQPKPTARPAGQSQSIDTDLKSSLLQRHLQEFNDLLKVQPRRHTEQQLKVERARQREEQLLIQQRELNSLRSKHTDQFVPLPPSPTDTGKDPGVVDLSVQEEFERMRKEHLRKQQELERKRNEEEVQELKTYRKRQKWKELKVESTQKWFEREDNLSRVPPPKFEDTPAPSVNIWQQRNLRQQQVTSLRPRTAREEEEILEQVLLLSQKTAAQEEEQRRYREIMEVKNFIPEQLQKKQEVQPSPESNCPVDTDGQKKTVNRLDKDVTTKEQKTTEVKKNQDAVSLTKFSKPVASEGVKSFASVVTTKPPRTTEAQKNKEVIPSTKLNKPVANESAISFANAVTSKKQSTKEELENIWESMPSQRLKSNLPSDDTPKYHEDEEAPKRTVLTTNYANLVPPPKIHISSQTTEKESWDDDGQYLCVSSKLPITARDCLRWQTSAKVVMSANENRNNSASSRSTEHETKLSLHEEHSFSVKVDEKKSVVSLNQNDLKRDKYDMPKNVPGSGSMKSNDNKDLYGNIRDEKNQPSSAKNNHLVKEESVQNARNPWSNVAIVHQSGDPRPNAAWTENKQFPLKTGKSMSSDRIPTPLQNPVLEKATIKQNLKETMLPPSAKSMAPLQNKLQGTSPQDISQKTGDSAVQRGDTMAAHLTVDGACSSSNAKAELGHTAPPALTAYQQHTADDYWNVSSGITSKITRKTVQTNEDGEVKKSPDLSSSHNTEDKTLIQSNETTKPLDHSVQKTESLIASLQGRAYQITTSEGSSDAVHDYWVIPSKTPIKGEKQNSPSEIFVSPEKVSPQKVNQQAVNEQTSAVVDAESVTKLSPVLSLVQNKEKQKTEMSNRIAQEGENWEDEICKPVISKVEKDSIQPKPEKSKVQNHKDGVYEHDGKVEALQLPPKKMSSMFNKMAKFGINPNPIKKENTGESTATSLLKITAQGSKEAKPQRPGYKQRPMKLVSKPSKTFTETMTAEGKILESLQAMKIEDKELDSSSGLNLDNKTSLFDSTASSPTQEKLQSSEDSGIGSSDSKLFVNRQNAATHRSQKSRDPSLTQTTHSKVEEDWESELITLPTNSSLPTQSTSDAENFFKEKLRSVKKDSAEHRLPVLKNLSKHVEKPCDKVQTKTSAPLAPSSSDQNDREMFENFGNGGQFKDGITSQQDSKCIPNQPSSAENITRQDIPTSIFNPLLSTLSTRDTSMPAQSYSLESGPTGTTSLQESIDQVNPAAVKTEPICLTTSSVNTPEQSQVPLPPGLHLPTSGNSTTIPQAADVASANHPNIPNLGLPPSLPPHLVQAYLQYLATAGSPLGGGIGMLPAVPLLPGIAPLMSFGLPNPLLPLNLMGLPTQPKVDPTQSVSQPQAHFGKCESQPQSHDQPLPEIQPQLLGQPGPEVQRQSHDLPQLENQPQSHGQRQPEIQPKSHDQPRPDNLPQSPHCGKQIHTYDYPQSAKQGLFYSQSTLQSPHSKSLTNRDFEISQPNNLKSDKNKPRGFNAMQMGTSTKKPNTECWDLDESPVTQKSFTESLKQGELSMRDRSSLGDNQMSVRGIPTKYHDLPVSAEMGQFSHRNAKPDFMNGEERRWSGGRRPPFRSVFEKPSETKLPESLVKRKEQTRTVQALLQHVLKENQERKRADLLSSYMDRN